MGAATALLTHHVFVDLETTGLDPHKDRVIEVGAVFVERGEVLSRITQLCDPGAVAIPDEVVALTGISPADVAGQPPFEVVLRELEPKLAGWTVVAHNAEFERGFFAGVFERLRSPVLDSCELVHYLHPELPSHSLDSLIRWTGLGDAARHRALRDSEDTFQVLTRVLDGAVDQRRIDDVRDLLECLSAQPLGGSEPPLVTLLSGLYGLCHAASVLPAAEGGPNALLGYEERASRAYLRAFQRRCAQTHGLEGGSPELSSWFKRRYPTLSLLAPGEPPPLV